MPTFSKYGGETPYAKVSASCPQRLRDDDNVFFYFILGCRESEGICA